MAKPKAGARPKKAGRLHLRVSKELELRMHDYAERHSIGLAVIATQLFEKLLADEEQTKYEAEQV